MAAIIVLGTIQPHFILFHSWKGKSTITLHLNGNLSFVFSGYRFSLRLGIEGCLRHLEARSWNAKTEQQRFLSSRGGDGAGEGAGLGRSVGRFG